MFNEKEKIITFFIVALLAVGTLIFDYFITEKRLERIYKIEKPAFTDVMLEMLRN